MKKRIRLITAGLITLLLVCLAGAALAANMAITFTWTVEGHDFSVNVDKLDQKQYVLYLPGAFRGQNPVLSLNQDTEMTLDGTVYRPGEEVPVSQYAGQTVPVSFPGWSGNWNLKVMQGSEIPALFISLSEKDFTYISKNKGKEPSEPATMLMVREDGTLNAAETLTSFKTRGNFTILGPKKSFTMKMENKADLGGMGANKKWILLANWCDVSLLRNQITFELFRQAGMSYTPDCRQVDMYVNREYHGTYLLTEKIQLKKHRLEITDLEKEYEKVNGQEAYDNARIKFVRYNGLNIRWYDVENEPEDITGGYLLELELPMYYMNDKDHAGIKTKWDMYVNINEPTHVGQRGAEYIADMMNGLNEAALAKDGYNSEGKYYADYLDLHSFAVKTAIDELSACYDVRASSQFMFKEPDSIDPLLHAGPAWDFDWSYGNNKKGMNNPSKVDFVFQRSRVEWFLAHWLLRHEDFQQETRKAYEEVVYPAVEILMGRKQAPEGSTLKTFDEYRDAVADSAAMNFTRWAAGSNGVIDKKSGMTFDQSCAFLKNWIEVRMDALLENWQPGQSGK